MTTTGNRSRSRTDNNKSSRAATIVDVANLAGVSKRTVTRVLNSDPNVRSTTRAKILKAIESLNFSRSPLGLALARNRSYMIALVYDNPSADFLTRLQTGIMSACKIRGIGLYLHDCDYQSVNLADDISKMIANTAIDGLVLPSPVCDQQPLLDMLNKRNVDYVSINPKDVKHGLSVSVNYEQSAYELTDYLLRLGHTKIAFIKGHPDLASSAQRERGFRRAMAVHNVEISESLMAQGMNNFQSGRSAASALIQGDVRPTAIFANNDEMAAGVLYEMQSHRINVPNDISLIGFDNTPFSQHVWPRLTTASQPFTEIGQTAAALLIDQYDQNGNEGKKKNKNVTMECELLVRESSGSVRG